MEVVFVVPPGGTADLPVVARASAGASAGDDYGFIVLRKGAVTRRIPYLFLVTRPQLESQTASDRSVDGRPASLRIRRYLIRSSTLT